LRERGKRTREKCTYFDPFPSLLFRRTCKTQGKKRKRWGKRRRGRKRGGQKGSYSQLLLPYSDISLGTEEWGKKKRSQKGRFIESMLPFLHISERKEKKGGTTTREKGKEGEQELVRKAAPALTIPSHGLSFMHGGKKRREKKKERITKRDGGGENRWSECQCPPVTLASLYFRDSRNHSKKREKKIKIGGEGGKKRKIGQFSPASLR